MKLKGIALCVILVFYICEVSIVSSEKSGFVRSHLASRKQVHHRQEDDGSQDQSNPTEEEIQLGEAQKPADCIRRPGEPEQYVVGDKYFDNTIIDEYKGVVCYKEPPKPPGKPLPQAEIVIDNQLPNDIRLYDKVDYPIIEKKRTCALREGQKENDEYKVGDKYFNGYDIKSVNGIYCYDGPPPVKPKPEEYEWVYEEAQVCYFPTEEEPNIPDVLIEEQIPEGVEVIDRETFTYEEALPVCPDEPEPELEYEWEYEQLEYCVDDVEIPQIPEGVIIVNEETYQKEVLAVCEVEEIEVELEVCKEVQLVDGTIKKVTCPPKEEVIEYCDDTEYIYIQEEAPRIEVEVDVEEPELEYCVDDVEEAFSATQRKHRKILRSHVNKVGTA